jgi:hypothetical protein
MCWPLACKGAFRVWQADPTDPHIKIKEKAKQADSYIIHRVRYKNGIWPLRPMIRRCLSRTSCHAVDLYSPNLTNHPFWHFFAKAWVTYNHEHSDWNTNLICVNFWNSKYNNHLLSMIRFTLNISFYFRFLFSREKLFCQHMFSLLRFSIIYLKQV